MKTPEPPPNFVEVDDLFINLDRVNYMRYDEQSEVLVIYFAADSELRLEGIEALGVLHPWLARRMELKELVEKAIEQFQNEKFLSQLSEI